MRYPLLIDLHMLLIVVMGIVAISFLMGVDARMDDRATQADKMRIMEAGHGL